MASETIALVDKLVRAKMPKETATALIDFVEKNQSSEFKQEIEKVKLSIDFLKWVVGLGFSLTFAIIIYLHSDTTKRTDKLESKVNKIESKVNKIESKVNKIESKVNKLESTMNKIESKIDRLLTK